MAQTSVLTSRTPWHVSKIAGISALVWTVGAASEYDVPNVSAEQYVVKAKVRDDQVRFIKSQTVRIPRVIQVRKQEIREETDKITVNKALRYLVSSVVELLDVGPLEPGVLDGASVEL